MKIERSFEQGKPQEFGFPICSPRRIQAVDKRPIRWPKTAELASEYVEYWKGRAGKALADLCLSRSTLDEIASHVSRKTGEIRMTDKALSSRSGRSLRSTERDLARLRSLGFLQATYEGGGRRQERVRVIRLTVPDRIDGPANAPLRQWADGPANGVGHVGGLDLVEVVS